MSSVRLPENKIALGILNRFHRRAETGSQCNDRNWSGALTNQAGSNEGEQLFMHTTAVNEAACRATREKVDSEGPIIGLFRRETESGQSTWLQSILLEADSKQHCLYIRARSSDALGFKED